MSCRAGESVHVHSRQLMFWTAVLFWPLADAGHLLQYAEFVQLATLRLIMPPDCHLLKRVSLTNSLNHQCSNVIHMAHMLLNQCRQSRQGILKRTDHFQKLLVRLEDTLSSSKPKPRLLRFP